MKDLKDIFDYFREHKAATIALITSICTGAFIGGILGATAYYNGWLG